MQELGGGQIVLACLFPLGIFLPPLGAQLDAGIGCEALAAAAQAALLSLKAYSTMYRT